MADNFKYDVFLSHSAKDKAVVRSIAKRLREDGLRVWFDEWEIRSGESISAKTEEGLEHSRVLVLCMSAHAFGSDWPTLESQTLRFRNQLNKEHRFIPLRLDEAPFIGSLAPFLYINWLPDGRDKEYAKLLEACRPPEKLAIADARAAREQLVERAVQLDHKGQICSYAFSPDGKRALSGGNDNSVRLWDMATGLHLLELKGHTDPAVGSVAWSADQRRALSGSLDTTMRLWDVEAGRCLRTFEGHTDYVISVAWSTDQRHALSSSTDKTVRLWDLETGRCLRVFEGHTGEAYCVAWSADQRYAFSGGSDHTLRLWDLEAGRCLRVLEGHTGPVYGVAWSTDGRHALSGSRDETVRLWDADTGRCLRVLKRHSVSVISVAWSIDQHHAFSGDQRGGIRVWALSELVGKDRDPALPI